MMQLFAYSLIGIHVCMAIAWSQGDYLDRRGGTNTLTYEKAEGPEIWQEMRIPTLPEKYTADWEVYVHPLNNPSPWYPVPPAPYEVGRGVTYYDFAVPAIAEYYQDFCLPIFGSLGYHWSCVLLHVNQTSYIVSKDKSAPYGPCCIWRQPWKVPSPDFVKVMKYNRTDIYLHKLTDWYTLDDGKSGVYSYGFSWTVSKWRRRRLPAAFTFPLDVGWSAQNFFNIRKKVEDPSVFNIPESCRGASYCVGPPV